jgi:transcriptional regulator with XRE-family HTH domain
MLDYADVARPISNKLRRQTKTLGAALGTVITRLRVQKQWSQRRLAERSGYESSSVSRVERGKANPTMALLIVMADVFRLRPSQLLARAERLYMKHETKRSIAPKTKQP